MFVLYCKGAWLCVLEEQPMIQVKASLDAAPAFAHGLQRVLVFARLMLGRIWAHPATLGLTCVPGCCQPMRTL